MAKIHSLCLANTSESNRSILLLILITIIFAFLFIFSKNDRSIHVLACRPLVGTSTITEAHAESAWLWWYPSSCLATNAYGVLKDANDLARSRHLVLQQWPAHLLDHFWGSVIHFSSISLVAGKRNCTEVSRVCPSAAVPLGLDNVFCKWLKRFLVRPRVYMALGTAPLTGTTSTAPPAVVSRSQLIKINSVIFCYYFQQRILYRILQNYTVQPNPFFLLNLSHVSDLLIN